MEKLKNIGCIAKMKKTGKKRLDWWHRNRVGTRANMLKKMYNVNVPVVTIEDGEQEEQQNFYSCLHATSDNWRNMYRNLLIPAELQCLNPGCLVSDLIIEAFLQYLKFEYADENVKQSTIALSSYFCTKLRSSTHKTITTANGAEKKVPRND
ncbi:uncharacterized protein LOC124439472, partial [Xenia sp. Carnegie-2017]|uniref:uncharacterized protein LOC124439472 n=1 Tax=Xenia sp. Carnegie-2017 TaxID=2897299 RepID=UPI001F043E87